MHLSPMFIVIALQYLDHLNLLIGRIRILITEIFHFIAFARERFSHPLRKPRSLIFISFTLCASISQGSEIGRFPFYSVKKQKIRYII